MCLELNDSTLCKVPTPAACSVGFKIPALWFDLVFSLLPGTMKCLPRQDTQKTCAC